MVPSTWYRAPRRAMAGTRELRLAGVALGDTLRLSHFRFLASPLLKELQSNALVGFPPSLGGWRVALPHENSVATFSV